MNIVINEISENEFNVTVNDKLKTTHKVFLDQDLYFKITNGKITKHELIKLSFLFLLKKEPNTSILSNFRLNEIPNYFPDYMDNIKKCF